MIPPAIPGPDHIEAPPGFEPRTCVRPPADVRTCVRHDLCTIANALLRRTLARAVRSASDAEHWQEIAEDFDDAAHAAPMETWRGARAASRAAEELARGLVGDAAAALADYYGLTVDAWHATTAARCGSAMKAVVSHITAASSRRVVVVINVAVEPGTAPQVAADIKAFKPALGEGLTDLLAELTREAQRAAAVSLATGDRPTLGALVRYVLADFAEEAEHGVMASVISKVTESHEWRGIAETFSALSCVVGLSMECARDLSACYRAACAMADGDETRAAQELAALDGVDLNSWVEATEEEIVVRGARGSA